MWNKFNNSAGYVEGRTTKCTQKVKLLHLEKEMFFFQTAHLNRKVVYNVESRMYNSNMVYTQWKNYFS